MPIDDTTAIGTPAPNISPALRDHPTKDWEQACMPVRAG
jgi:hypothetical protein